VDEAGKFTEALGWPVGYEDCVWLRIVVVKNHFCHIFLGTNPTETLLQFLQSSHLDFRLSARYIVAGVTTVDERPERWRSDTLPCPCSDDVNHFTQRLTVPLSTAMSS
jgi:hypothetical protein